MPKILKVFVVWVASATTASFAGAIHKNPWSIILFLAGLALVYWIIYRVPEK